VVVNYESGSLLLECVRSLLADAGLPNSGPADTPEGGPEVVVVDNGSTDGSVAVLSAALPDVPVITPGANLGYAAAANRGIAATRAPVVAVCNCDLVQRAGTAAAMVARFDAEADLGALGPVVRDPEGAHYPSACNVPSVGDAVGHGVLGRIWPSNPCTRRYRELDADPTRARDVDWVSGAALWLRREALDAVGGWNERYFMYVEDVELCWRLRRDGWRVGYEPGGEVTHRQGASTAARPYRMIVEHHRSLLRFAAERWHGVRRLVLVPAAIFLGVRATIEVGIRATTRAVRSRPSGRGTTR